jgi:hypothetical protein
LTPAPVSGILSAITVRRTATESRSFLLANVSSCAVLGLQGALVSVEVDIGQGLPNLTVVGLPDTAVQEARERVRAAIRNSGCLFPNRRPYLCCG